MAFQDLPPIKRVVDWEWTKIGRGVLEGKTLVMRCYEDFQGRLYRTDTGALWVPEKGQYRFRGEVQGMIQTGGNHAA